MPDRILILPRDVGFLVIATIALLLKILKERNLSKLIEMKKIFPVLILACLSLTFLPQSSFAVSVDPPVVNTTTPTPTTNALLLRLNEIKNMDRSKLSSSEKKTLRKEVRTMKREAMKSGGVFLTVGALLIVIVLLILLL